PRRGGRQLGHLPDPVAAAVRRDPGDRRHGPAGAAPAREPRLPGPGIGPARAGRAVRLAGTLARRRREWAGRPPGARQPVPPPPTWRSRGTAAIPAIPPRPAPRR